LRIVVAPRRSEPLRSSAATTSSISDLGLRLFAVRPLLQVSVKLSAAASKRLIVLQARRVLLALPLPLTPPATPSLSFGFGRRAI
jgi:hypothetical protein